MANNALQKIVTRAKQIARANKNISWKAAIKRSSAEYNSGKKGKKSKPVKRAAKKRPRTKKRIGVLPRPAGTPQMINGINGNIGSLKKAIRNNTKVKLANALLSRDMATTKTARRKAGKKVVMYRTELKKYS